jgi:uncharacterized protein (TIGR04255 family)
MAAPRTLSRPPISEALVDFRASMAQSQEAFEQVATRLRTRFPTYEVKRGMKAELRIEHGKLIPPIAEDLGFQGITLTSSDGTSAVQFGPEGFTFNNLKTYLGGDRLIAETLELWAQVASELRPQNVGRVALRYINHLELPLREGDQFEKFLTAVPDLPDEAPQRVSEFLGRVVAHEAGSTVVVTQRMKAPSGGLPTVIIDVDVFRAGDFGVNPESLRSTLEALRILKNRTFFSLLTEEAVALYTA